MKCLQLFVVSSITMARALTGDQPLVEVEVQEVCDGQQFGYKACNMMACPTPSPIVPLKAQKVQQAQAQIQQESPEAQDCVTGPWGDWSSCDCSQLRERQRSILYHNDRCGSPCNAVLSMTQNCVHPCHKEPIDCDFGPWTEWTSSGTESSRERVISKQPLYGGNPCVGFTKETKPVPIVPPQPIACEFSDWTAWTPLSMGSTQSYRSRGIAHEAQHGGLACESSLKETRPGTIALPTPVPAAPCNHTRWSAWGPCLCDKGYRMRTREQTPGCPGYYGEEYAKCANFTACPTITDVDCKWQDWSLWSDCTCSCGGGQKTRDRNIMTYTAGNGAPCKVQNKTEISPCNTQPCPGEPTCDALGSTFNFTKAATVARAATPPLTTGCVDGEWDDWLPWDLCNVTCGGGLQQRKRNIRVEANSCGTVASGVDTQFKACNIQSCQPSEDCEFGNWTDWSTCSCECPKRGTKHRSRTIVKYGSGDGKFCHGDDKQIAPCGGPEGCPGDEKNPAPPPEPDKYCQWDAWKEEPCNSPNGCGPGQKVRSREYKPEDFNICSGPMSEIVPCQLPPCSTTTTTTCTNCGKQDCVWGLWAEWGACDKCGGQRKRFRNIAKLPIGDGAACEAGASEEINPCPRHCHQAYYCEWGAWQPFSICSTTCGAGQMKHVRKLKAVPVPENGRQIKGAEFGIRGMSYQAPTNPPVGLSGNVETTTQPSGSSFPIWATIATVVLTVLICAALALITYNRKTVQAKRDGALVESDEENSDDVDGRSDRSSEH